jgi:3-hydroxyisobutyrate dehydrogenase
MDRLAGLAGTLLRKDVRLVVDLADQAAAHGGVVLDAADAALAMLDHPR